jgi:hypothetical protein
MAPTEIQRIDFERRVSEVWRIVHAEKDVLMSESAGDVNDPVN